MLTFPFTLFSAGFSNNLSVNFNGVDEGIGFGDNHNFEHTDAFTLSIWIKIDSPIPATSTIWGKATNDVNVHGWIFYVTTGGNLFLQLRSTTSLSTNTSISTMSTDAWHHVVFSFSGNSNRSGISFYIDGVKDALSVTGAVGGTMISTTPSHIGVRNTAFRYEGNMDEMTFWDKELSQSEVTELYNSGNPNDPKNSSMSANLINYYRLGDGDTSPTVTDRAGSADGTMINMDQSNFQTDVP